MTLAVGGMSPFGKVYTWAYADATARAAASGLALAEIGSLALQEDDHSLWILSDNSPTTWVRVSDDGGGGGAALTVQELDGSPSDTVVTVIKVPSGGGLTDNGTGDVTLNYMLPVTDTWHVVGAGGEPAYTNSWVAHGTYEGAAFRKYPDGIVRLRGVVKSGTSGSIFTLPSGYRPTAARIFPALRNTTNGGVEINTDGTVVPSFGSGNTYLTLDAVAFPTD